MSSFSIAVTSVCVLLRYFKQIEDQYLDFKQFSKAPGDLILLPILDKGFFLN